MGKNGIIDSLCVQLKADCETISLLDGTEYALPNIYGAAYGYFEMEQKTISWLLENLSFIENDLTRYSLLIQLNESLLNKALGPIHFLNSMMFFLRKENNLQIFSQGLDYTEKCIRLFLFGEDAIIAELEIFLLDIAQNDPNNLNSV